MARGDSFKKIGYKISGSAYIKLGNSSGGWTQMDEYILSTEQLSKEMLLKCVNDGGCGSKEILKSNLIIEDIYKTGRLEFNRNITIKGTPERQQFFKRSTGVILEPSPHGRQRKK